MRRVLTAAAGILATAVLVVPGTSVAARAVPRAPMVESRVAEVRDTQQRAIVYAYTVQLVTYYDAIAARARAAAVGPRAARCHDGPLVYGDSPGQDGYPVDESIYGPESGGWYYSCNEASGACGAYQVIPSTWDGYAGYDSACDAPPEVQDAWVQEHCAANGGYYNTGNGMKPCY